MSRQGSCSTCFQGSCQFISPSCGHTHDVKDRVQNNNHNNHDNHNNHNNPPPGAGHRVVAEGLSSQSVRPLRGLTGEARSRPGAGQGSPLRVAPLYRAILVKLITFLGGSPTPRLPCHQVRLHCLFPWSVQDHGARVRSWEAVRGSRRAVLDVSSWSVWERRCVQGGGGGGGVVAAVAVDGCLGNGAENCGGSAVAVPRRRGGPVRGQG